MLNSALKRVVLNYSIKITCGWGPCAVIFQHFLNPFTPGNFAKKNPLKLVKLFSGHYLAKTNQTAQKVVIGICRLTFLCFGFCVFGFFVFAFF